MVIPFILDKNFAKLNKNANNNRILFNNELSFRLLEDFIQKDKCTKIKKKYVFQASLKKLMLEHLQIQKFFKCFFNKKFTYFNLYFTLFYT